MSCVVRMKSLRTWNSGQSNLDLISNILCLVNCANLRGFFNLSSQFLPLQYMKINLDTI